jgi:hypothetical protein
MTGNIDLAIRSFDLDQSHAKIYADPNELIESGFPASFLLPLIRAFSSSEGYKYLWRGRIVSEIIGISHGALISAIACHVGVPDDSGFTGRGFSMQAQIEAIRKILEQDRQAQIEAARKAQNQDRE